MSVEYDPYSAEAHADPYPIYKSLRDEAPLYHHPVRDFWAVSRYADVAAVSRDWESFTVTRGVDIDNAGDVLGEGFFLAQDPPVHGKMRDLIKQAFGLRSIKELTEDAIRRETDALVKDLASRPSADLAFELAWTLPARAMSILLGYPLEDSNALRDLGMRFMTREAGSAVPPPDSDRAGIALMEYFKDEVGSRVANPRDDLLTTMACARIDGEPIGDAAEGMALLVFVGGFENVACMLTNALYWLARHPDQRGWLADNPEAIPAALDEVLRFDSPQQIFKRTTTRDVELRGQAIPAGQPVLLLYAAANRDERYFENPDSFDVRRKLKRNLAFGDGIHFCLGAALARLEGQIVLETVLREMPDYELSAEPELAASHAVRGFTSLPVAANRAERSGEER